MKRPQATDVAGLELFADCTKGELRKIRSLVTYVTIPRDQVLMREGSVAREFIIIDSGTARVSRVTDHGLTTVAEVGSGEFLGEMALLNDSPRTATAIAATDLVVLVSSANEFRAILEIAPSVANKVLRSSQDRADSLRVAA